MLDQCLNESEAIGVDVMDTCQRIWFIDDSNMLGLQTTVKPGL